MKFDWFVIHSLCSFLHNCLHVFFLTIFSPSLVLPLLHAVSWPQGPSLGCSALTQNQSPNPFHFAFNPAALPISHPPFCSPAVTVSKMVSIFSSKVLRRIRPDSTYLQVEQTPASCEKVDKGTINLPCCCYYVLHPSLNFCIIGGGVFVYFFKMSQAGSHIIKIPPFS